MLKWTYINTKTVKHSFECISAKQAVKLVYNVIYLFFFSLVFVLFYLASTIKKVFFSLFVLLKNVLHFKAFLTFWKWYLSVERLKIYILQQKTLHQ